MKNHNSEKYADFQIQSTPLKKGTSLLEASAGTGKTYTIEAIYLRLIIEEKLLPKQILTVTFTEAATAELRERIRGRLKEGLSFIQNNQINQDEALSSLLQANVAEIEKAKKLLHLALLSFDESQIFTIHGFCKRALSEYAFESASSFNPELVTSDTSLFDEVSQDYWRLNFYNKNPILSSLFYSSFEIPGEFSKFLKAALDQYDVKLYPPFQAPTFSELEEEIKNILEAISSSWKIEGEALREKLSAKPYSQNKGNRESREKSYIAFDALLENPNYCSKDLLIGIDYFSQPSIQSTVAKPAQKKGHVEENPFTIACEEYKGIYERTIMTLYHDLLHFGKQRIDQTKADKNVLSFDDLLKGMGTALEKGSGLADSLAKRYQAVLIDEFQDTDPLQWKIFNDIFGEGDHHFYLIGDPKQAIYAFRGADIFTYFNAAKSSERQFSLATNYRSTEKLVRAVNAVFSRKKDVFRFDSIQFSSVNAGAQSNEKELSVQGETKNQALQFIPVGFDEEKKITKPNAENAIARHIAYETQALLKANTSYNNRSLEARDIAVLVRKKKEAQLVQKAFNEIGIQCVLNSDESVFESKEAKEVIQLLSTLINPTDERLLRALLLSSIFGKSISDLEVISQDESSWIEVVEKILNYKEYWNKYGFISMYRQLFFEEKLYERLAAQENGERKLTNFLHLGELLNEQESQDRSKEETLLSWLQIQVQEHTKRESQEHEIRIESDDKAIQVITMHKSKGLQYPIVFCPFSWDQRDQNQDSFSVYNSPENKKERNFSLKKVKELPTDHQNAIKEESYSDALRLFYVALTRAISRCYVYVANYSGTGNGPIAQTLCLENEDVSSAITRLVEKNKDCMHFHEDVYQQNYDEFYKNKELIKQTSLATNYKAKDFNRRIPRIAHFGSFSGLTKNLHIEKADRYEVETESLLIEQEPVELIFPKGAKTGDFFHGIFENIRFSDSSSWEEVITKYQERFSYDSELQKNEAYRIVRNAMQVPLKRAEELDFCLQDLVEENKKVESEFYYPIQNMQKERLAALFEIIRGGKKDWGENLHVETVKGYLKGFIDLMFLHEGKYYILDWKTNYLGENKEDYSPERLQVVMQEHHYDLQYMLYIVALDLYLKQRLENYNYSEHFGGVYYLFVRGIDPLDGRIGVFNDLPNKEKIEKLSQTLLRKNEQLSIS